MEKEGPWRALLLGLMEVRQPLEQLDMEGRSRLYTLCHGASVAEEKDEVGWLGWQEHGLMGVEVTLDQEHLHVTSNEVLVSRHSLVDVGAIVAMPGSEGHLVVIGQCQVKGLLLAVVLDLMSQADARRLVEDLRERVSRLAPPSVQPSAQQDTACRTPLPSAPLMTEMDPFVDFPHTPSKNATSHPVQATGHHSPSSGSTTAFSPIFMKQPASSSSDPFIRPPLPDKPPAKPVANAPVHATLLPFPLRSTFRPPFSRAPNTTGSTSPASNPPASTRPVLPRPQCTPPAPPLTVSNSTPPVSTPPFSTPTVSIPSVSTQPVFTPPVSTPPVFNPPASSQTASSEPASTIPASTSTSTPPASTCLPSKPKLPTRPVVPFTGTSRQFSLLRVPTPLVSTLPGSSTSASTPTVSSSSVFTPGAPTPFMSSPRVVTPLVLTPVPNKKVPIKVTYTPSGSTQQTFTRPAFKPAVAPRPLSSAPIFTTSEFTAPVSTTPVSSSPISITSVSAAPVSTAPPSYRSAGTAVVSSLQVSTPLVSSVLPSTVPASLSPVITAPAASQDPRRHSVASSSSLEEDNSNGSGKTELILDTLSVDESEYLFIRGMKKAQEEDSVSSSSTSSSLEHELYAFLENEHRYLDTLRRIKDARKAVKSELQNLLRRNERLVDFHEDLFKDLHEEFPSCSGVAQVFLSRKEDLDQYRYYLMNAPQVIHQLGKQTEEVKRQHPTLEADLKSSWKRLHYYFMTFDKLIKVVSDEEQPLVQEVADLLRDMNRKGDSAILIDAVSGAPFSLHTLDPLLLHGLFTIKDSYGALKTKAKYHVLLFEEMIVITWPKKEGYQYKDHLPIRQLNLQQANGDEATFVLNFLQGGNKKNRKFTFKSRQKEARDAWVQEITRLHFEYAKVVKHQSQLRYGW